MTVGVVDSINQWLIKAFNIIREESFHLFQIPVFSKWKNVNEQHVII